MSEKRTGHYMQKQTDMPMLDVLKLFFCICVIALHTKLFSFNKQLEFGVIKSVFRVAVPYFFVVSGFLLGRKLATTEDKKQVIKKYCTRLLMPLCFFSIINICERSISMVIEGKSIFYIIAHVVRSVVFYPYGALWYVQASIIGALLLLPFLEKKRINLAICIGSILYFIALFFNNYYGFIPSAAIKKSIDLILKVCISARNGVFVGFVFLAIGIKCAQKQESLTEKRCFRRNVVWLVCSYALYLAEVVFIKKHGESVDDGALYIALLTLAPALVCVAAGIRPKGGNKVSRWLSSHSVTMRNLSTGMYFLHRPILWACVFFFENRIIHFVIVTIAAYALCMWAYGKPKSFMCRMLK